MSAPLSEFGRLEEVVVTHPRSAFAGPDRIAREWRDLNFTSAPDFSRALGEYDQFLRLVTAHGAILREVPTSDDATIDAIYVRDASIVTPHGMVCCRMGKPQRAGEPVMQRRAFERWGLPVVGIVEPPGQIEGGDLVWLDSHTLVVGRGYRTNDDGIRQLRALLPPEVECVVVPLVHWRGPNDVFHLMSFLSPVDADLAVVYSPLMPVTFREFLVARGMSFVEVPDQEFESMGANVLAIAPRVCVMVDDNPITRQRLQAAGATVAVYRGDEISLKGGGGPTCLTRPIRRA